MIRLERIKCNEKYSDDNLWMRAVFYNDRSGEIDETFQPYDEELIREIDSKKEFNDYYCVFMSLYVQDKKGGFRVAGGLG